ncbi:MAG: DUF6603 domain-containing protein [Bacteroidota bacterium]
MANNNPGTFERMALDLSNALTPLVDRFHQRRVLDVFAEFGLVLPMGSVTSELESSIQQTSLIASTLQSLTEELIAEIDAGNTANSIVKGIEITLQIRSLIGSIDDITSAIDSIGYTGGLTSDEFNSFIQNLPWRLTETLFVEHLKENYSIGFRIFELLGLISLEQLNSDSTDELRPLIIQKKVHLDRVRDFLDNPMSLFESTYLWGDEAFKGDLFINRLYYLFHTFGIPVGWRMLKGDDPRPSMEWYLFSLSPTTGILPKGIEAKMMVDLGENFSFDIPISDEWGVEIDVSLPMKASLGIRLQPPADLSIPLDASAQGKLGMKLIRKATPEEERISIFSIGGGSGISATSIGMGIDTIMRWDSDTNEAKGEFGLSGKIEGGKVLISSEGSDGFLATLLSNVNIDADFDLGMGWNSGSGFFITGSGSLNILLPLHIDLGPIIIDGLTLSIGIEDGSFPLEFSTNILASLGPLKVTVERIGASATISPAEQFSGNLGPLDVDFGFKPPNGLGLAIDAGAVKGGGYLFLDFDRGEYAGALELTFSEWISLKAVGLITTKMPDGSKGFSLLIIITAEFGTGIQLGFGFTLLGVGGILGLNRTVNIEPLKDGVRSGAIQSVMFPQNVVENAPRILSDLRQFFPTHEGQFLVGPMAKIGYGTPTLVSISLGVIIEFPDVNFTILGILKVALPTEDAPVLKLQVNFLGRVEPSNKLLWFYAELYDSRVLTMTIEGGMGLLVNWGDQANFVISVGGFHPRYTPPPLPFPSPPRLAINILNTSVARIRVEGYFAVTSNTVQFGAKAELFFGFSAFKVEGHLSFDALFQFEPFYFIIEISAKLSVKVFGFGVWGISLSASLEGPTPWHIKGKASFKVTWLGPRIRVNIEKTWGESKTSELPPIAVLPLLQQELEASANWEAVVPANSQILVSLRKIENSEQENLVLHPIGALRIRQRKMPLNLRMDKFGTQRPSDYNRFDIAATVTGITLDPSHVQDQFASAEFLDLDDAKKLSSPGFEPQDSGIQLSVEGTQVRSSLAVKRENRYEMEIIDNNFKRFPISVYKFAETVLVALNGLFSYFLQGAAVSKSTLSQSYQLQYQPFTEVIDIQPMGFSVASNSTNKPMDSDSMNFSSQALAQQCMEDALAKDPKLAGSLHIIPNTELNLAA